MPIYTLQPGRGLPGLVYMSWLRRIYGVLEMNTTLSVMISVAVWSCHIVQLCHCLHSRQSSLGKHHLIHDRLLYSPRENTQCSNQPQHTFIIQFIQPGCSLVSIITSDTPVHQPQQFLIHIMFILTHNTYKTNTTCELYCIIIKY